MNGNPSKQQRKFHLWAKEQGCSICYKPSVIHHIRGAKMKLKGINGLCGEWYILPLCFDHHINGVHKNKFLFEEEHGKQKDLWNKLANNYNLLCTDLTNEIIEIIYNKV